LPLLAVHISDNVLQTYAWILGLCLFAPFLAHAMFRVGDEEIPRISLLTAAFFVASSIHVRIPPTSVHLLLNGLVGVVLGRRAALSIVIGLALQALLLGHGAFTTLGVNAFVLTIPALMGRLIFVLIARQGKPMFPAGFIAGTTTVATTALLNAAVLIAFGVEDWTIIAGTVMVAHMVLAVIEGVILGTITSYLAKVKPELLRLRR
jgi:cobalt/nickel transport system permease protein